MLIISILQEFLFLKLITFGPSRIRTYIRNLEGFCPNPLDDRPFFQNKIFYSTDTFYLWTVLDLNQWPSACKADALPLS